MVFFFVLDQKNPFWVNLIKKIKIVSLSWNLVPRLIWISGIQWWCSLFLFLTINIFLGQIWSKNSKLFKVKFHTKTNSNMQNLMMVAILSVLDWILSVFVLIWSKNSKESSKTKFGTYPWVPNRHPPAIKFFEFFPPRTFFFHPFSPFPCCLILMINLMCFAIICNSKRFSFFVFCCNVSNIISSTPPGLLSFQFPNPSFVPTPFLLGTQK